MFPDSNRTRAVILSLAALALGITSLYILRSTRGAGFHSGKQAPDNTLALETDSHSREVGELQLPEEDTRISRRTPDDPRIIITTDSGLPIAGAQCRLVQLDRTWLSDAESWPDVDWSAIARYSRDYLSGANGEVRLDPIAESAGTPAFVLWITHPDYLGKAVLLDSARSSIPPSVILSPSVRTMVRVVGEDGVPVAGATVVQLLDLGLFDHADHSSADLDSKRVARWTFTTDELGLATLPPLPYPRWIEASFGSLRSGRTSVTQPGLILIRLAPTFSVHGAIHNEMSIPDDCTLSVRVLVQRQGELTLLDRLAVQHDLTWGTDALPVLRCEAWLFQLEGDRLALDQVRVFPPREGDHVQVEFHATPGLDVAVRVTDQTDRAIAGSTVIANWNRGGTWTKAERLTDSNGLARFRNCDPAPLWLRVKAPGHAAALVPSIEPSQHTLEPIVVKLEEAGRIRGQVVHGHDPVRDFTLIFWRDDPNVYNRLTKIDVPDGRFDIDEAPIGEVNIVAVPLTMPHSATRLVLVDPSQPAEVLFEIPDGLVGTGRVVDAQTNEPIVRALVQAFCVNNRVSIRPMGDSQPVDTHGSFILNNLAPAENTIQVDAPGFAPRNVSALGVPGQPLDFGLVGLFRTVSLDIRLLSIQRIDFKTWRGELVGSIRTEFQSFSDAGHLRFSDLRPDVYRLTVVGPDMSAHMTEMTLRPGSDRVLTVPVDARHLLVNVVSLEGQVMPTGAALRVCFTDANGEASEHYYPIDASGRVDVSYAGGDQMRLEAQDSNGLTLAIKDVSMSLVGQDQVTMILGTASKVLRVVDLNHLPIPGVKIIETSANASLAWSAHFETDSNGEASITCLPEKVAEVFLNHPTIGTSPSTNIDLSDGVASPIELVFAPHLALEVELAERSVRVPAMYVEATDQQGCGWGLGRTTTNEQGLAHWGPVSKGSFTIEVRHPGYWAEDIPVQLGDPGAPFPIQVRRLGSLSLTVKTPLGNPAPNAPIELLSNERHESVASWLAAGRVLSSTGGMKTDSEGRLRIDGLPNGPFHWRAVSADGNKEGDVVVLPQTLTQVEITAP